MKRTLLLICTLLCANVLFAQAFWVGDLGYSVIGAGEVEVNGCNVNVTSVNIPSTVTHNWDGDSVRTYSVTSIYGAFGNCSNLTSVTIPNSVTSIGGFAFWGCSSLTSIDIPNSVTSIEEYGLANWSGLTSIDIPNSVTYIGAGAFAYCDSLTSVTIGNSVTSIGNSTFWDCSSLTSVTIGNSVTSIGEGAFYHCSSLTSITIPNSVTSIGEDGDFYGVFQGCSSLTTLNFNAINCNNFDYYCLPFAYCPITTINIGNSVQRIPDYFAYSLDSLTSVTIGNSVTSIGEKAFKDCSNLTSVTFGNSVTSIGNSVTSIGYEAFKDCSSLTSINIPNSVTSIGNRAFQDCSSLTSVTIGNSVTSIGDAAFDYCISLTSVTIGNSVTSIGDDAFSVCISLTSVTIPNSVTSIGTWTFGSCISLTSITIGNSVTSIGNSAFAYCDSLTSVTCLANTPPSLGEYVFSCTPSNKILNVNCGLKDDYILSWGHAFDSNNIFEMYQYNVVATVNNEEFGSVAVENNCSTATLSATANEGYLFVNWNDGNTENPRLVSLTIDTSFVANFIPATVNTDITATICQGQTYTENGFNVSESGVYTQTLTAINGADSIVTLTLNVNPTFNTELSANICQGQVYNENGFNVSEAGVYTQTLTSVNGCDSIVTLTLNVNPTFDTTINATINAGETYAEFGFNESEAGTYVQNLQTEAGCDSTITLVLSVNSSLIDIEETKITFYPNPTKSEITFSQAIEKIEVIDLTGKTIFTFTNAKTINIESLPAGAYYLRLTNDEKTSLQKVIKQ